MSTLQADHLQPLRMGQIIDRAIRLYRRNFLKFLGISALIQIPLTIAALLPVAALWYGSGPDQEQMVFLFGAATVLTSLVSVIWSQIGAALMTQMASDSYLGWATTIADAFSRLGRAWLTLLGALLLLGLVTVGVVIVFIIPCVGWLLAVPGGGIVVYFLTVVLPLLTPVIVLERPGVRRAIRRAWELTRNRFWWLFGFFVLLGIFSLVVVQSPVYFFVFATASLAESLLNPGASSLVQVLISGLIAVLYYPIQTACAVLVYFDLRVRQEGLDLALQAADDEERDPLTIVRRTPQAPTSPLITGTEWAYFLGIALIVAAVFGLLFLLMGAMLVPFLQGLE